MGQTLDDPSMSAACPLHPDQRTNAEASLNVLRWAISRHFSPIFLVCRFFSRFAHLKRILCLGLLHLRGPSSVSQVSYMPPLDRGGSDALSDGRAALIGDFINEIGQLRHRPFNDRQVE